ncbi:hypothetical protein CFC21_030429, partial [Triticum aestivum]
EARGCVPRRRTVPVHSARRRAPPARRRSGSPRQPDRDPDARPALPDLLEVPQSDQPRGGVREPGLPDAPRHHHLRPRRQGLRRRPPVGAVGSEEAPAQEPDDVPRAGQALRAQGVRRPEPGQPGDDARRRDVVHGERDVRCGGHPRA